MTKLDPLVATVRRASPLAVDSGLALALFVLGSIEVVFLQEPVPGFRYGLPSLPLLAASGAALALRRRKLWLSYIGFHAAAAIGLFTHYMGAKGIGGFLMALVLVYTVAKQASAVAAAAALLVEIPPWLYPTPLAVKPIVAGTLSLLAFFGLGWFAGQARRRRQQLVADLEQRTAELRRERARLARLAVAKEQSRIAGELRSLVIQGIEAVTEQALAARRTLDSDMPRAPWAIGRVEENGRQTLVEMRRLLGVLRRTDAVEAEEPLPAPEGEARPVRSRAHGEPPRSATSPAGPLSPPDPQRIMPQAVGAVIEGETLPGDGAITRAARRLLARRWVADGTIVAILAGYTAIDLWDGGLGGGRIRFLLAGLTLAALLVRRTFPFPALLLIAGVVFVWIVRTAPVGPDSANFSLQVTIYTVAAYRGPGLALGAVGVAMLSWSPVPVELRCVCILLIAAWSGFAAIAGQSVRAGRKLIADLEEQAELLARTREEAARLAVRQERLRVAREMHDVVAHAITAIVLQAGGARIAAPSDPAQARKALDIVASMGGEALMELRSLVGELQPDLAESESEPSDETPSIGDLLEDARRSGLEVGYELEGEPGPLDRGMELSLYRIVQEALTNVRRHARGATARVRIRYAREAITVEVVNGPGQPGRSNGVKGAGQGLIGIAERAAVFGGEAEAEPTSDGGFRVSARLPKEPVLV